MQPILIAGAGPTGLSAALLLSQQGRPVRIIDKGEDFSRQSKALGVNPRTLSLLESTGVTEELLARGRRLQRLNVWREGKRIFRLDLHSVEHRYNFMLVHGQGDTERLLAAALERQGVTVEHGVELVSLRRDGAAMDIELQHADGRREQTAPAILLGADGLRSTVRQSLEIPFPGEAYGETWELADVDLEMPLPPDEAHVFLLDGGVLFTLRVRDAMWRLAGNLPGLMQYLPAGTQVGAVHWESQFLISNRVAERMQAGPICLAGDAAHVHSPLGARGMNLGVEDASVFTRLVLQNRLAEYESRRLPVVRRVVQWVDRTTQIPRGHSFGSRFVRQAPWLVKTIGPWYAPVMRRWLLGLDHDV